MPAEGDREPADQDREVKVTSAELLEAVDELQEAEQDDEHHEAADDRLPVAELDIGVGLDEPLPRVVDVEHRSHDDNDGGEEREATLGVLIGAVHDCLPIF